MHNLGALADARAKPQVFLAAISFADAKGNHAGRDALRDCVLAGGARDRVIEN